ncbi:DUF7768 domain-containing protein [Mesorhizobium sp. Cs1299R1N3]|uniref:DUF7768 domain-containing protein n=1 Tax=Mesorhizobium sp. Cs1299R1N3 TaxID=3015173 RepID=UPI00301E0D78
MRNIFAYTAPVAEPEFVSINERNGEVSLLVRGRGDPTTVSTVIPRDQVEALARAMIGRVAHEVNSARLVIIESPFAGHRERNIAYARRCVRDSLQRGEAPIASHLLYTQEGILDDDNPVERALGIDAGLAWRKVAEASVVYTDLGISSGMKYGIAAAEAAGRPVEYRSLEATP